jgi:hypothetical protein
MSKKYIIESNSPIVQRLPIEILPISPGRSRNFILTLRQPDRVLAVRLDELFTSTKWNSLQL